MRKRKPCYSKAIVIVHGKCEKQICDYIKSKLRLKMYIESDKKGENPIQITSLMNVLNNSKFKSLKNFIRYFEDVEIIKDKRITRLSTDFKIFTIMDTDDCTSMQKKKYINKGMFKKHWAYDYIEPIYNSPELEDVLVKAGIPFKKQGSKRKSEYIKIFPTNNRYSGSEEVELNNFCEKLKSIKDTNMDKFIDFCLKKCLDNKYL